jgi:DNA-binding LytR/AlgR family response regulator
MLRRLKQPFPLQTNTKNNVTIAMIAGICIFLIFFIFRPFGFNKLSVVNIVWVGLAYGGITIIISLFCNTVIPKLLPTLFDEQHWIVLYEILFLVFIICTIATANFIFTIIAFKGNFSFPFFINILKYTIVFGIAPILISVLVKQQNLLNKYANEAKQLEEIITNNRETNLIKEIIISKEVDESLPKEEILHKEESLHKIVLEERIQIKGTNQKESLSILVHEFLYAEAADNYTNLHYINNKKAQQSLFRMTIKNIEEQHQIPDILFRCHKSYIVNLYNVNHISGNAQGYRLHVAHCNTQIPVSRSLNGVIKQKLSVIL